MRTRISSVMALVLLIMLGMTTGQPAPAVATPLADSFTQGQDWDGDGHPDFIVTDTNGLLRLYRTTPTGIVAWRVIGGDWLNADLASIIGDLDEDGHADIVARIRGSNELWLFPGDGRGGTLAPRRIGTGWGIFSQIISPGDWNGDGHVDLIAQRSSDNSICFYAGNGSGGYAPYVNLPGAWAAYVSLVAMGDFDGDSKPDFIARTPAGTNLLVEGDGAGGVAGTATVGSGFTSYTALIGIGDYTGDGNTDVIGRTSAGELKLFAGNGTGGWISPYPVIGTGWGTLRFSDTVVTTPAPPLARVPSMLTAEPAGSATEIDASNASTVRYHLPGAPIVVADTANAALGAALANGQDATLVVRSTADAELTTLAALVTSGSSSVSLVGGSASFPTSYRSALATAGLNVNLDVTGGSLLSRSITIAEAAYPSSDRVVVVSDTAGTNRIDAAATYAITNRLPLVIYETGSDENDLAAVGAAYPTQPFVSFGPPESVAVSIAQPVGSERDFTENPDQAVPEPWVSAAVAQVQLGANARFMITAPATQRVATMQAALISAQHGMIFQPGSTSGTTDSPATRLASMWGIESFNYHIVGSISETERRLLLRNRNDVAAQVAAPAFRVTAVAASGTDFTLTLARPSGAVRVKAYDAVGTLVANSTATSITVTGPLGNLLLVAESSSGAQVGTAEFKTNIAETIDNTTGVPVLGTEASNVNSLTYVSGRSTPRLITRVSLDPMTGEEGSPEVVGFTCSATTSFAVPDPSLQWRYEIAEYTLGSQATCSTAGSEAALFIGGVTFPAEPPGASSTVASSSTPAPPALAASWSYFDQQLLQNSNAAPGVQDFWTPAAAATWPDLYIRYQALIEQKYVYVPIPFPPFTAWRFAGDNRSPYTTGTSRVQATVRISFANHTAAIDRHIGESHRWTCYTTAWSEACWDSVTDTAPSSTFGFASTPVVGSQSATFSIVLGGVSGQNPLYPSAPPIDARIGTHVRPGNSYFLVSHDRMPTHVLMWGFAESEYHFSYVSRAVGPWCLFDSSSSQYIPGCHASSRVQF